MVRNTFFELAYHPPDPSPPESDYAIFAWRFKSSPQASEMIPVLYLRDVDQPLPSSAGYRNPAFYMFRPKPSAPSPQLPASPDSMSMRSSKSRKKTPKKEDTTPRFKVDFEKFHNENGVRTVMGSIGPVNDGTCPFRVCIRTVYTCSMSSGAQSACFSRADIAMCIFHASSQSSMVSSQGTQLLGTTATPGWSSENSIRPDRSRTTS